MGVTHGPVKHERPNYSSYRARSRGRVVRRRRLRALVAVVVVVVGAVLLLPLARRAIEHFELPLQYTSIIRQEAAQKRVDPALIAAVIYAETKFYPRTSAAGAVGLMQIEPRTAEFLARRSGGTTFEVSDLSEPDVNIAYGSYYLRYLLDEYGGNKMLALAAYNGGESNVDTWVAQARRQGHALTIGDIPFPETRDYVTKVLTEERNYRRTYPSELGYG
jgi:soluble lytic murein transglycosylase